MWVKRDDLAHIRGGTSGHNGVRGESGRGPFGKASRSVRNVGLGAFPGNLAWGIRLRMLSDKLEWKGKHDLLADGAEDKLTFPKAFVRYGQVVEIYDFIAI